MIDEQNPFASPQVASGPIRSDQHEISEAEMIRKLHIEHEKSIKSAGELCLLIGGIACLVCLIQVMMYVKESWQLSTFGEFSLRSPLTMAISAICAVIFLWVGWGLQNLKRKTRIPAIILSVLGLILFPIGTAICAVYLYFLCTTKGAFVFTPEYQEIILQTPQVKRGTSLLSWLLLLLFLLFVAACFLL